MFLSRFSMLEQSHQSGIPSFHLEFLLPKFWGRWFIIGLSWLSQWLPRTWIMTMGIMLGNTIRRRNKKRRRIVEVNIALCFPDLSQFEKAEFLKKHFHYYGCMFMDLGTTLFASSKRLLSLTDFQGLEHLTNCASKNRIVVTYHTTAFEMTWMTLLGDKEMVGMMKRDASPLNNWLLYKARCRFGRAEVLMRDQSLRRIIRGLQAGKTCFLVPDEDIGNTTNTTFASFFNQDRATLNIISRLAKRTNAKIIPSIARLDIATGRFQVEVSPALENFPLNDLRDAININQAMEGMIAQSAEQYMWTFKWFQNRPDGLPPPYDV